MNADQERRALPHLDIAAVACTLAAAASLSALGATLGISAVLTLALAGSSAALAVGALRYLTAAGASGEKFARQHRTPAISWLYRHLEDLMSGIIAAGPLVAVLLGRGNPFEVYASFVAIGGLQVLRRRRLRAGYPVDDGESQGLDDAGGAAILAAGQPPFGHYEHERPMARTAIAFFVVSMVSVAMRWSWPPLVAAMAAAVIAYRTVGNAEAAADRGELPRPIAAGRVRFMTRTYLACCLGPAGIWYLLATNPPAN